MEKNWSIRLAQEADLPAIYELYAAARQFMKESGNPDQWADRHPASEVLKKDIALRQLYVCLDDEDILGVFCYFFAPEPDYHTIYQGHWLNAKPYGVVHRIASGSRQRGVASFCLDYAFRQCGNLRIDTHRNNIPMQKVLAKNGFSPCGIIYIADGSERIAYQKAENTER